MKEMMMGNTIEDKKGQEGFAWMRVWKKPGVYPKVTPSLKRRLFLGVGVIVLIGMVVMIVNIKGKNKEMLKSVSDLGERIVALEGKWKKLMGDKGVVIEVSEDEAASETARVVAEEISSQLSEEEEPIEVSVPIIINRPISSGVREFFVPFAGGDTRSRSWVDINAAQVTIDEERYDNIKEVYFEASLHIINGNVSARLVNVTEDGVYHDGVITHNNSVSTWKTSSSISLGSGNKTYRVQLKSDSGEVGVMDQARLRILVE